MSCSSPEEIIKTIKSLGLVSRAYDIFEICNILCNEKCGKVPSTARELNALPGVGRYITNVVLTMGFGKPKPMVDSNVKRILSRLTGFAAPYENSDRLWNIYNEILKIIKYREMHFAMIDLAHQVCVPNQPLCSECPVRGLCRYNKEKIQFSVK